MISASIQAFRRRIFDRLVLRPSRGPIDFGTQQRVALSWGDRNEKLECFVQICGDKRAPLDLFVVKFPGTAGRAERSSLFPTNFFPQSNAEVWTWNPPGYGGSAGRASLARIERAALEFWTHAIGSQRITDKTRVWIVGNSLGCATALHLGAHIEPMDRVGMVLRNPPPLDVVVKHVSQQYPLSGWVKPVADSLSEKMNATIAAQNVTLPAVFMQSELDELVLPEMQQAVIDAYVGKKQFVSLEGLTHGGIATEFHEPIIQKALQWLWQETSNDE